MWHVFGSCSCNAFLLLCFRHMLLISVCKNTQSALKKRQDQGVRRAKKRSVQSVHEHFLDEHNEDIAVFLEALINTDSTFVTLDILIYDL